jgi:DNA-binding protein HU-beta
MAAKPMTKTQIVTHFAETMQVPKKTAVAYFDELSNLAVRETKRSGQFVIPGIGKLVKSVRKARKGRNPQTGEEIQIPKKTVVKFRVAKACKDAVVPPKK